MNIAIIGAGNVAWHLTRALSTRHRIVQVFSRSLDNAQALAEAVQCPAATDNIGSIVGDADAYIIMVKDDAIAEVAAQLAHINDSAIWMHTSGSCGCNALSNTATSYGVLYPLQTFSRNATIDTSEIPLFVEANTVDALSRISEIARCISSHIYPADSDTRRQLHIAAVFACNFANGLWRIADDILAQSSLPFSILMPLLKASIAKLEHMRPSEAQTGPAARGDIRIIDSHLSALTGEQYEIYKLLSDSILNHNKQKHE